MNPAAVREPEPDPREMAREALRDYLQHTHTVSLWPFTGRCLGLSRAATYGCPQIKVLRLGRRCRVSAAWLENLLFGPE